MKRLFNSKKGFTLIELLAVIVVLAIIMIIAIPNILNTMNSSKKNSFKVYAEKMFNIAQEQYETERLNGTTVGGTDSSFKSVSGTYTIGIKSKLAGNQSKYEGCVIITPVANSTTYNMTISMTDKEFSYSKKGPNALDGNNIVKYASDYSYATECGASS